MAAVSRNSPCGLHFIPSSPGDPDPRASVTKAAGRPGGHPLPGSLARLFRAGRGDRPRDAVAVMATSDTITKTTPRLGTHAKNKGRIRIDMHRVREIGWSRWDPIGLGGTEGSWKGEPFEDEYDAYLLRAAGMLRNGQDPEDVADYLLHIEIEHMGLRVPDAARLRAKLLAWARFIRDDALIWRDATEEESRWRSRQPHHLRPTPFGTTATLAARAPAGGLTRRGRTP